jgi:hypothetical protein
MTYFGNQYTGRGTPIPRFPTMRCSTASRFRHAPNRGFVLPDHGRGSTWATSRGRSEHGQTRCVGKAAARRSQFRDPYALFADCFLVADPKGIWTWMLPARQSCLQLPATAARLECTNLARSRPTREPVVHSRVERKAATGALY